MFATHLSAIHWSQAVMKIFGFIALFIALAFSPLQTPKEAAPAIDPAVEAAAMKVLDEYMAAWNNRDMEAWERTFQFPHYRLASGKMSVLDHAGIQDAKQLWAT